MSQPQTVTLTLTLSREDAEMLAESLIHHSAFVLDETMSVVDADVDADGKITPVESFWFDRCIEVLYPVAYRLHRARGLTHAQICDEFKRHSLLWHGSIPDNT